MTDETEIQETITPTASMPSGNTPQDIVDIYNVLAPMSTDYANANIERAGQAQASYGPLAQAAMGNSQTAGVGNYTYNRLVRPSVDTMRDQLIVSGLSTALNKQISDSLNAARENYNRAARRYNRRKSGGGGDGGGGDGGDNGNNPKGWDGNYEDDDSSNDPDTINQRQGDTGDYILFWMETKDGTRNQGKLYKGGTLDTPTVSYENGEKEIRDFVSKGGKIYNKDNKDITSRFK